MKKMLATTMMCLAAMGVSSTASATTPVMRVTLLGTGVPLLNSFAPNLRARALSGLLVQAGTERLLFDCGQGVYSRLLESASAGVMSTANVAVDKVFISHLHSDHIADLAALYSLGALYRHKSPNDIGYTPAELPLKVWGPGMGPNQPTGTFKMMRDFRDAYDSDFYVRQLFTGEGDVVFTDQTVDTSRRNIKEIQEGVLYRSNGVKVTAFLVNHEPVSPSYGFRVDYKGHSFVYSGDTAPTPNLVQNATGVDLLVHEVYGFPRDAAAEIYDYHTSPEDFASEFANAQVKQVVYSHMVMPPFTTAQALIDRTVAAGYTGKIEAGMDLMTLDVNDDSTVTITAPGGAAALKAANKAKQVGTPAEVANYKK
jgi:ribonuclease Z